MVTSLKHRCYEIDLICTTRKLQACLAKKFQCSLKETHRHKRNRSMESASGVPSASESLNPAGLRFQKKA